jgi:DHA1 family tetracycline resistance protein-like MFS transporter
MSPGEPTQPPREKMRFPILYPLWLAVYVDILGYSIQAPLFPAIESLFHVDLFTVSMLLSTNALFGFICGPILGSLSDKYGRKPLLLISEAGTMMGFLLFAFAPSIEWLFLSRVIDGVFGGIYPITRAVIGDAVPIKFRSKQMANMGLMHIIASLMGPALGGILVERTGSLAAPGTLAALLALASILLTGIMFKETLPYKAGTRKLEPQVGGPVQANKAIPLTPDIPIRRNRVALYILAQWGTHAFYFSILVTMTSLYMQEHLGLGPELIGYFMMLSGVLRILLRFAAFEPIINKFGDKKTSIIGLSIFVVAFGILVFVDTWVQFLIVMIMTSFAATCARGPMNTFMSRSVSKRQQGRVQGLGNSEEKIAEISGPIIGGSILGAYGGAGFGAMLFFISIIPLAMSFKKVEFVGEAPKQEGRDLLG